MTLGVDFGGSSSKATLLDCEGKILATSTQEYPCYFPEHGWAEYDAQDLYRAFVYNIRECLAKSGVSGKDISAIALDAATHMAVFCGKDDKPLRRIIHWSDNRSSEQVRYLKENCADVIKRFCVNSPSPAWTLPQIMWLNEHEPEVIKNTKRIYFAKDYIRHMITGDFLTDSIEAMGPMLANDYTGQWSEQLCELGRVDVSMLPEIKQPTDIAVYVCARTAAETGLSVKTPVIVGSTDTVLEIYASGAIKQGYATVKLATAGRICPITDHAIDNFQFFNYRHIIPGLWYPGTTSRTCAASYKWYRDVFGTSEAEYAQQQNTSAYEILNRAAEEVAPGSEGLFFHPYLQGELTPYYDDSLRASFTGMSMHHTKGHFSRAVMEGISYSMRDCLEEVKAQNIDITQYRIIGGGAKGKLWRQILCDILATPLTCTIDNDSSLGSAMLAGVAVGMFGSFEESVERCVKVADEVTPIPENVRIYDDGFRIYREIEEAMAPVYRRMK